MKFGCLPIVSTVSTCPHYYVVSLDVVIKFDIFGHDTPVTNFDFFKCSYFSSTVYCYNFYLRQIRQKTIVNREVYEI